MLDHTVAIDFLGIQPTENRLRWQLPVTMQTCGASGFLHGGCALGSAVTVLEAVTQRQLAWVTAQYVSRVGPGDVVELVVDLKAEGKAMTQAALTAEFEGRVVFHAVATLGGRDVGLDVAFATAPDVPPPLECPGRENEQRQAGSFTTVADVRVAKAELGSPHTAYWARLGNSLATTSTGLAMFGDLLPSAVRIAMGREMRGSSLDNTLRMAGVDSTEWLLLDIDVTAIGIGVAQGVVRGFSQNGVLLGSASQSFGIHSLGDELLSPQR